MNLYLSSYMIGDHADLLLSMAGGLGARMAVITNALDGHAVENLLTSARTQFDADEYFAAYGFDPSLIDLRRYVGRQEALRRMLLRHKVIWTLGGNTFLLRRAMRESGFDEIIRQILDDGLIYGGFSAGACVVGDSLQAVGIMDEPDRLAPGYLTTDVIWDGLGLVPFAIIPHYESDHVEAPLAAKAAAWAADQKIDVRTLRDGEVLLVKDSGPPTILSRIA